MRRIARMFEVSWILLTAGIMGWGGMYDEMTAEDDGLIQTR